MTSSVSPGYLRTAASPSYASSTGSLSPSPAQTRISVNVCVRVKPAEVDNINHSVAFQVVEDITDTTITLNSHSQRRRYAFDKVFHPSTEQEEIFEYVEPSLTAFLQGYNVSLMAYGQSGSGKSYTIGTSEDRISTDPSGMGLIARVTKELFHRIGTTGTTNSNIVNNTINNIPRRSVSGGSAVSEGSSIPRTPRRPLSSSVASGLRPPTSISVNKSHRKTNSASGYMAQNKSPAASPLSSKLRGMKPSLLDSPYSVTVSYLEIYNEQLRDLLNRDGPGNTVQLAIREDPKGGIHVKGLKERVVTNFNGLLHVLNESSALRQTGSTAINSNSSRSHAIFTINLTKKVTNPDTGIVITTTSKMNFVDLAGSERLKNIGAADDNRAKEGISINSGLASLGKVISELSLQKHHISYRDSKLTRLLQDSLGGKAITYLIACVTMDPRYVSETLNTLTYAQRARSIQLTPEIYESHSKEELTSVVANLKRELQYYKDTYGSRDQLSPYNSGYSDQNNKDELNNGSSLDAIAVTYTTNSTIRDRISRSDEFHSAVQEVISEYDEAIMSLKDQIKELKLARDEKLGLNENTGNDYEDMKAVNDLLRKRVEYLEAQLQAAKANNSHDPEQKQGMTDNDWELQSLKAEIQAYRREHRANQSELQHVTAQYNRVRRELDRAKDALKMAEIDY